MPACFKISSAMSRAAVAMAGGDAIDGLGDCTSPAAIDPATLASSSLRRSLGLVVAAVRIVDKRALNISSSRFVEADVVFFGVLLVFFVMIFPLLQSLEPLGRRVALAAIRQDSAARSVDRRFSPGARIPRPRIYRRQSCGTRSA